MKLFSLNRNSKAAILKEISQDLSKLENADDVQHFLRGFLTPKEVSTLCDRYKIIQMLMAGVPQREISKKLNVSISQISRGSEELQFGVGAEIFPKLFGEEGE